MRDHPRSRGVYCTPDERSALFAGSSPLARGLQMHTTMGRKRLGIIPARAGFTDLLSKFPSGTSDHPRSRGVYPSR